MTSANGLEFLSWIWTENRKLRFLHLLGNSCRGRSKPGQEAPEKLSFKSCKLLNAVCPKTFPKSAEKRKRAH